MATVTAIIHGEPGTYGISFPDFPGAVSGGSTLDEALSRARETLAVHIEAITEEGMAMPTPRALEALKADPEFAEDFATAAMVGFVTVDLPGRAKRISVTIDERLLERIDQRAEASGETRSGFLAHAARKRLAEQA